MAIAARESSEGERKCFWKLEEVVSCYVELENLSEVSPAQYVSD